MKGNRIKYYFLSLLLISSAIAGEVKPFPPMILPLTGDEPPSAGIPRYTPSEVITASPGMIIGSTQADYQASGSTGRQIAKISYGNGIQFTWMKNYSVNFRQVYSNYYDNTGSPWPGVGIPVSYRNGAGYPQIDTKNGGEGIIVYHQAQTGAESLFCAVEPFPGLGQWDFFRIPNRFGSDKVLWPHISRDHRRYLQVVATQGMNMVGTLAYTRSTNNGQSWSTLARVDSLNSISAIITSSPVSNRVAIIYTHPIDTSISWESDIYYVESLDGVTWDFANNRINITEYGVAGDSLYAWNEVSAVYDYDDNLHIIWNAEYVVETGIRNNCQLLHFNKDTGIISQISQFSPSWPDSGCDITPSRMGINSISIARDTSDGLLACFVSYDSSDCSAGGYANGDIYMSYSVDSGLHWLPKSNITNSRTANCMPGDCDSDNWLTLAELADTNIYLIYLSDKDAGFSAIDLTDITDNPVLYLTLESPLVQELGLCDYIIGDINGSGELNLTDITYGILCLKGFDTPAYRCLCTYGQRWYVAGDVNGDCRFNGVDICYMVNYFKGGANPRPCPNCPPIR